jgi:hypothetical protein
MPDIAQMETTVLRDHTYRAIHRNVEERRDAGYYVLSGGQVIQRGAGANMSVDVAVIEYLLGWIPWATAAVTNVAIDVADGTNDRIDVLYVAASGTLTILKGTARAKKPSTETTWQKYEEPYPTNASSTPGLILAEILVRAATTSILNADIRMLGSILKKREFVTAPIEVDHAASSPVALGTAPANSIVEPIIRCTENESGCVLTIGDEDDADSHCADALMPVATTAAPVVTPLPAQYYASAKALRATITTAGTSGKWLVQFRIILVGA